MEMFQPANSLPKIGDPSYELAKLIESKENLIIIKDGSLFKINNIPVNDEMFPYVLSAIGVQINESSKIKQP